VERVEERGGQGDDDQSANREATKPELLRFRRVLKAALKRLCSAQSIEWIDCGRCIQLIASEEKMRKRGLTNWPNAVT
jgi:hypothetical protein